VDEGEALELKDQDVGERPDRDPLRRLPVFRCKATWKREFKLPWRKAGPPNHLDGKVNSDQKVLNKEISKEKRLSCRTRMLKSVQIATRFVACQRQVMSMRLCIRL